MIVEKAAERLSGSIFNILSTGYAVLLNILSSGRWMTGVRINDALTIVLTSVLITYYTIKIVKKLRSNNEEDQ